MSVSEKAGTISYCFTIFIGLLIRCLFSNSTIKNVFQSRIEISTPLNSWKRVTEGLYLWKHDVSPYTGDLFHEVPLALATYQFLMDFFGSYINFFFILIDIISAAFLATASRLFLQELVNTEKKMEDETLESFKMNKHRTGTSFLLLLTKESNIRSIPFFVFSLYLFSPFSVVSCIGQATTTLSNFLMAFLFFTTAAKWWFTSAILISILAHHSFYPCMLVVPLVLAVYNHKVSLMDAIGVVWLFGALQGILMYLSFHVAGKDWQFLHSTYGALLTVPDLTPNIGLFWYFFTEMFEQFRSLFLWTFQINVFIYAIPLSLRFRSNPMFLLYALSFVICIFKSYPCLGDHAIPMALLPMWKHNFQHMRQSFLVGCILGTTFLFAPLLWHLWVYAGSANSNFYFGISLAFNTAQIFLLTDLLFAACKRNYYLENKQYLDENGKPLRLDLK